jgi:molybdenum cofactor cytidylyltransferase
MGPVSTPIVLLAAGSSSRLGSPKQLLPLNNNTLLEHSLGVALEVSPVNTFLVLGAAVQSILPLVQNAGAHIVNNPEWPEGIASSIRAGLKAVLLHGPALQVILMVCDQPFLNSAHLNKLSALAGTTTKGIIASEYKLAAGTPVLFKREYFDDLLNLHGDNGAKKLFNKYASELLTVPFINGEIDIDTVGDYKKLKDHDQGQV